MYFFRFLLRWLLLYFFPSSKKGCDWKVIKILLGNKLRNSLVTLLETRISVDKARKQPPVCILDYWFYFNRVPLPMVLILEHFPGWRWKYRPYILPKNRKSASEKRSRERNITWKVSRDTRPVMTIFDYWRVQSGIITPILRFFLRKNENFAFLRCQKAFFLTFSHFFSYPLSIPTKLVSW